MIKKEHLPYQQAKSLSLVLAIILFATSFIWGRKEVFLWLNHDLGFMGDAFFTFCTYLAEGWMWIPYFLVIFFILKKDALFIVYSFVFSTLLTQIPKHLIFNTITRPGGSGIDPNLIHTVKNTTLHTLNSFPSGHTATAFTIFLVSVYLFDKKWMVPIGLLYATLCGYSRVYLAQHFPMDLAGGILVAIASIEIVKRIRKI